MKIAICVKYVPVDSKVQVDPATHALIRNSGAGEINPSDRYAVEMARRLKKDGDTLDVFTMGPADAVRALKVVLALGADHAYLLNDKAFAGSGTSRLDDGSYFKNKTLNWQTMNDANATAKVSTDDFKVEYYYRKRVHTSVVSYSY